jgi:hypothetical protein
MADAQILYVSKDSKSHEGITHLGSSKWKWTKAEVVKSIEEGTNTFFTKSGDKRADVYVREGKSGKYVQTKADGVWANNLVELPDFPTTK